MSSPSTVYGSRLRGWWFENTTGSPGVSTWTAETGANLTQASSPSRPTTTTTPVGKKAIVIDESVPKFIGSTSFSSSGTAFQLAFAFNCDGMATNDQVAFIELYDGASTTFVADVSKDSTGALLEITNLATFGVQSGYLSSGWHTCVLDVDTSGNATLYLDGSVVSGLFSVPTDSGATGIGGITTVYVGDGLAVIGTTPGVGKICSPVLATDTSNFTSTDTSAITEVLASYISNQVLVDDTAIAVSDSSTQSAEYGREPADTISVSETVAKEVGFERPSSDTVTITDSEVTSLEYGRILSDTSTTSDTVSSETVFGLIPSDTISVSDSLAVSIDKTLTDTVSTTESTIPAVEYDRTFSDSTTTSDSVAWEFHVSPADNTSALDSTVLTTQYLRTVSDTPSSVDSLLVIVEYSKTCSDASSVTDSPLVTVEYGRTCSDASSVADSPLTTVEYGRTLTEAISVGDSTSKEVSVFLTDSVSVADSLTAESQYIKALSDTVIASDSLAIEADKTLTDTVQVSDSPAIARDLTRTLSDIVAASESMTIEAEYNKIPLSPDNLVVTDSPFVSLEVSRAASDTILTAEGLAPEMEFTRHASDTAAITTDSAFSNVTFSRTPSDSINVPDSTYIEVDLAITVSDPNNYFVPDLISRSAWYERLNSVDTLNVSDSVARTQTSTRSFNDTVSTTDSIDARLQLQGNAADVIHATDLAVTEQSYLRKLADFVDTADQVAVVLGHERSVSDAISVTDSTALQKYWSLYASDTLLTPDTVSSDLQYHRTVSDTVNTLDGVYARIERLLQVATSDVASIGGDNAYTSSIYGRSLSDSTLISDTVTAGVERSRLASDLLSLVDAVIVEISIAESPSDALAVSDSVQTTLFQFNHVNVDDAISVTDSSYALLGNEVFLSTVLNVSTQVQAYVPGRTDLSAQLTARAVLDLALGSPSSIDHAPTPANLEVPPSPSGSSGYRYIIVQPQKPVLPPQVLYGGVFQAIERELKLRNIKADVIRLSNGGKAYRVYQTDVWRLRSDAIGPYIQAELERLRATEADPTIAIPPSSEWYPTD